MSLAATYSASVKRNGLVSGDLDRTECALRGECKELESTLLESQTDSSIGICPVVCRFYRTADFIGIIWRGDRND